MEKYIYLAVTAAIIIIMSACGENEQTLKQPTASETSTPTSSETSTPISEASLLSGKEYLFAMRDPTYGNELWVSDGSASGTRMVKDIRNDTKASDISDFITYKEKLLFNADDGIHGQELYMSDGTPENTFILKDLIPGAAHSSPSNFTLFQDKVYFSASNGLWHSDGTADGTYQVYSLIDVHSMVIMNHKLYFIANSKYGYELWTSDGTFEGTHIVKDINPGGGWGVQSLLHVFNDTLIFTANDVIHGNELWKSDGTAAGTVIIKDISPGASSSNYSNFYYGISFKGQFYFAAHEGSNSNKHRNIWVTDGTEAGTKQFFEINDDIRVELYPFSVAVYKSSFYFLAQNNLYKSDGTTEGTSILVRDVKDSIQRVGDILYIINRYGSKITGTPGVSTINLETGEIKALMTFESEWRISDYSIFKEELYFIVNTENFQSLYRTNGTKDGTVLVNSIKNIFGTYIYPSKILPFYDQLFFTMRDVVHNTELWSTDGTKDGTSLFKDINSHTNDANPSKGTWWKETYYFAINEPGWKNGLYKTDGTNIGTEKIHLFADQEYIKQIIAADNFLLVHTSEELWVMRDGEKSMQKLNINHTLQSVWNTTLFNGRLYFFAFSSNINSWKTDGTETIYMSSQRYTNLWKTDGTEGGTEIIYSGITSQNGVTNFNGKMFFIGDDNIRGYELYISDGTTEGTTIVKDINIGSSDAMYHCSSSGTGCQYKTKLYIINNHIYFGAFDGDSNFSLWKSDGSNAGTIKVSDEELLNLDHAAVLKDALYYIKSEDSRWQFCKYDDATHKSEILKTVDYQPKILQKTTNLLYLSISEPHDSNYLVGLWKSNGSQTGTVKIKEFKNTLERTCVLNDILFFTIGSDASNIWASDGTETGTLPLIEKVPEASSLSVQHCHIMDKEVILDVKIRGNTNQRILYSSDGTPEGTHRIQ